MVVDASDPTFRQQLAVTQEVLGEIGADEVPAQLVLNKIDRVDPEGREILRAEFPTALQLSAKDRGDVARLREHILRTFDGALAEAELFLPWENAGLLGDVHAHTRVVEERHEGDGIHLKIKGRPAEVARILAKHRG